MDTFKIGVLPDSKFVYKVGSVTTNKAWSRPNKQNLENLVIDIRNIKNFHKYELFLVGGVVNGGLGKTTDIDIIVNGNFTYELEKFFHDLYDLALNKHRLLIDVKWLDKKPSDNHEEKIYQAVQFGMATRQIDDSISIRNLFEKNIKLTENLVLRTLNFPNKHKTQTNINYIKI
jgi:predicted nucleotidyltransferase